MISIAGIIGAGLFIASGKAIATAGPAVLVSYLIVGLIVFSVMRMLGEMAIFQPDTGSFSTYADSAFGKWAGFTIGWLYWWFWVLIIPVEAIAGGSIINNYLPELPVWLAALLILAVLTGTNLFSVKGFGEFEFWFALIKVVAIIAFLILGTVAVLGWLPLPEQGGFSRLTANGGFMPHGFSAIIGAMLLVVGSFFGAEIVTIAAAESRHPERQITTATNLVVWRIAIFYIFSMLLVTAIVNWNDPRLTSEGTFQTALEMLQVPNARVIVDIIVLVAVTSCLNSAIYTASRMLYSLSQRGDAPASTARLSSSGVPRRAVLGSSIVGLIACLCNFVFPDEVFNVLLATTGAMALLVYVVIAASQIRLRYRREARGETPALKMWCFPYLSYLTMAVLVVILGYMMWSPDFRIQAVMTALVAIIVVIAGLLNGRRKAKGQTHSTMQEG